MKRLLLASMLVLGSFVLSGCPASDVGKLCIAVTVDGGGSAVINSQALECNSRVCFHPAAAAGSSPVDLCTDFCGGDDDCNKGPKDNCAAGFACAVAVTTGPLCCRKMCVCKSFLTVTDAGVTVPEACNPSRVENRCRNLEGR